MSRCTGYGDPFGRRLRVVERLGRAGVIGHLHGLAPGRVVDERRGPRGEIGRLGHGIRFQEKRVEGDEGYDDIPVINALSTEHAADAKIGDGAEQFFYIAAVHRRSGFGLL